MNFRAVIFDLDGTLLDSLDDLAASVNHTLASNHFAQVTVGEVRRLLGNGVRALLGGALPPSAGQDELSEALATFRAYYREHCMDATRPFPGIEDMLRQLREQGCQLAIVSNKPDEMVQLIHARYFANLVDLAVGEREDVRRKPAPDGILWAAQQLGAQPDEVLYVGDSEVDLAAAEQAGVACLSVTWGYRSRKQLAASGALHFAETPTEVALFAARPIAQR